MSDSESITSPVDLPIVFILGKGRSGTTLLQTMLDAHPNTIAPMESRFVIHFRTRYGKVRKWTSTLKNRFVKDVLSEQKIELLWDIDVDELKSRINTLPENCTYGDICQQVYASGHSFFDKEAPQVIVDKNPIYALLIPHLLKVYPNARFIHMIRDYRASASSVLRLLKNADVREQGFRWLLSNGEIEQFKKQMPDRFYTIRYEDLLQGPEEELSALCKFLELDFDTSMIQYHEKVKTAYDNYLQNAPTDEIRRLRALGAKTVHKNLSKKIDPSFIDKWKTNLTEEQIRVLDEVCGAYGKQYNYIPSLEVKPQPLSRNARIHRAKINLYYNLPIWLRELKSKPNLAYIEANGQ